jgi:hypothetical protein
MQLMLALFFIAATGGDVSCTPNSLTPPPPPPTPAPRAGQVRALWPLLLQCEHRLVIATAHRPARLSSYVRARRDEPNVSPCGVGSRLFFFFLFFPPGRRGDIFCYLTTGCTLSRNDKKGHALLPSFVNGRP